jgi:hypothetical protein
MRYIRRLVLSNLIPFYSSQLHLPSLSHSPQHSIVGVGVGVGVL